MAGDWRIMVDLVTFTSQNEKYLNDANTEFKTLSNPDWNNNWITCHDVTNTDYQVPVGKKFIVLDMWFNRMSATVADFYITSHNVVDSSGGTRVIYWGSGDVGAFHFSCNFEIPAGYYLNVRGRFACVISGIETSV